MYFLYLISTEWFACGIWAFRKCARLEAIRNVKMPDIRTSRKIRELKIIRPTESNWLSTPAIGISNKIRSNFDVISHSKDRIWKDDNHKCLKYWFTTLYEMLSSLPTTHIFRFVVFFVSSRFHNGRRPFDSFGSFDSKYYISPYFNLHFCPIFPWRINLCI